MSSGTSVAIIGFMMKNTKNKLRVIGLMSGTSADGIDVAVVDIKNSRLKVLAFDTFAYPPSVRRAILDIERASVAEICRLNFVIGRLFADAAVKLCRRKKISLKSIDLIGSHGQTVYHAPKGRDPSTLQIGEPAVIAQKTGITTIADFRPADIAAGGGGAPLVPYADYILFADRKKTRVIQNIGGIANLTYLKASCTLSDIIAFDTGPGNMMMDRAGSLATGGKHRYDAAGRMALKGQIDARLLDRLMSHRFLAARPPKSTGREQFGAAFTDKVYNDSIKAGLSPQDIIAAFTAFTAASIVSAYRRFLPLMPDEVLLCGGGARNPVLAGMIGRLLYGHSKVLFTDDLGIDADAKEAVSFAILAAATVQGVCNNVPSATGAKRPVVLGKIVPA